MSTIPTPSRADLKRIARELRLVEAEMLASPAASMSAAGLDRLAAACGFPSTTDDLAECPPVNEVALLNEALESMTKEYEKQAFRAVIAEEARDEAVNLYKAMAGERDYFKAKLDRAKRDRTWAKLVAFIVAWLSLAALIGRFAR